MVGLDEPVSKNFNNRRLVMKPNLVLILCPGGKKIIHVICVIQVDAIILYVMHLNYEKVVVHLNYNLDMYDK